MWSRPLTSSVTPHWTPFPVPQHPLGIGAYQNDTQLSKKQLYQLQVGVGTASFGLLLTPLLPSNVPQCTVSFDCSETAPQAHIPLDVLNDRRSFQQGCDSSGRFPVWTDAWCYSTSAVEFQSAPLYTREFPVGSVLSFFKVSRCFKTEALLWVSKDRLNLVSFTNLLRVHSVRFRLPNH